MPFICEIYDILQTNKRVLLADILRGCAECLWLRKALSGRLCRRIFPGFWGIFGVQNFSHF